MDGIKDEPPANEEEDDGRGAWNAVHLGISNIDIDKFDVKTDIFSFIRKKKLFNNTFLQVINFFL